MIVEKGKSQQQQLLVQQQLQQQQQQQQQVRHRGLIVNCQASAGDENDEENIVIDMADEDDDEDSAQFCEGIEQNYGPISSIYSTKNGYSTNEMMMIQRSNKLPQASEDEENESEDTTTSAPLELRFTIGDLVWFDPNQLGYSIPGKVVDYYQGLSMLTVEGYAQPATTGCAAAFDSSQVYTNPEAYNKLLLDADQELQSYDLSDLQQIKTVKPRLPVGNEFGVSDLIDLEEVSLESITWNLKLRFKQELVYTRCGRRILLSVNPYKQLASLYNLDQANTYDTLNVVSLASGNLLGKASKYNNESIYAQSSSHDDTQLFRCLMLEETRAADTRQRQSQQTEMNEPTVPHIFQLANEALKTLLVTCRDQCFVLLGDSGAGKTEACKLLIQYLATVNKSPSNLMTEQILESIQVLESFGNAKTILNDNSSRFGKLLDIRFNMLNGFIIDAKTSDLNLLDRSRIVGQAENERNYHVFYEMLAGLSRTDKEKYGLQSAEKYFYLNQGHCVDLAAKEDGDDFRSLLASTQVLGFNNEEQDAIFRLLASVLHLGNVYFHRKVLALRSGKLAQQDQQQRQQSSGVEGVEVGSDTEVRWVSHLLQIQFDSVMRCLTMRTTESQAAADRVISPLNIDQALDTRDAIARALYTCLFKWLIERINATINAGNNDQTPPVLGAGDNANGPMYLCRTSESLCEFQPDKLATGQQRANASGLQQQLQTASISILDTVRFGRSRCRR